MARVPSLDLLSSAVTTGGWPYYAGKSARVEPTCWALLALNGQSGITRAVERGLAFLRVHQRPNGLIVDPGAPAANHAWNALALIATHALGDPAGAPDRARIVAALLAAKGIKVDEQRADTEQNNQLQAWAWNEGTFSWIEPTAWCLIALKTQGAGAIAAARVAEAEAVMLDRVCDIGGWNYGNATVLGQDLRPYVPTTALGLLAMQDRRDEPAVRRSLAWLTANATSERSAMALSLAAIALHVYGEATQSVTTTLASISGRGGDLDSPYLTAMSEYARMLRDHDAAAFRMPAAAARK